MKFALVIFTCATAFSTQAPVLAAADALPLKHGIYVDSSIPCRSASNATAISFWGNELNSAKQVGEIVAVSQSGGTYRVTLSVQGAEERWTVSIPEKSTIEVTTPYGKGTYRWCFMEMPF